MLLFRNFDPEQLGAQVLQAVAVGIGTTQLRGDFGAVNRTVDRSNGMRQRSQVETGEMEQLGDGLVCKQGGKARSGLRRVRDFHKMRLAIA